MTKHTTRRAVLAGAAATIPATAAVSLPMLDGADPIFAAIERHRRLDATFAEVCKTGDDDVSDLACDKAYEALADLVEMTPTTFAGCVAMLRYVHKVTQDGGGLFDSFPAHEGPASDLLRRLADRIEAVQA